MASPNPNGTRPKRIIRAALIEELNKSIDNQTRLVRVCKKLIDKAEEGDYDSAQLVFLYVDGKPETRLDQGATALLVNAITRTVVDPAKPETVIDNA